MVKRDGPLRAVHILKNKKTKKNKKKLSYLGPLGVLSIQVIKTGLATIASKIAKLSINSHFCLYILLTFLFFYFQTSIGNRAFSEAKRIDVISRIIFPLSFAGFNIMYWSYYLTKRHLNNGKMG